MAKRSQLGPRLSVGVTKEQKEFLEAVAARSQVPLALVIRHAVKEFMEKYRDRQLPLFDTRRELLD